MELARPDAGTPARLERPGDERPAGEVAWPAVAGEEQRGMELMRATVLVADAAVARWPWLRSALTELRFDVVTATDGDEVLDRVDRHLPDALILNVRLSGLDVYEVAARLTGEPRTAHLPIFLATEAGDGEALEPRALEAGADALLSPALAGAVVRARLVQIRRRQRAVGWHRQRQQEQQVFFWARDALVRVTLPEIQTMLKAGRRALEGVLEQDLGDEPLRYATVVAAELDDALATAATLERIRHLESGEVRFEPVTCNLADLVRAGLGSPGLATGAVALLPDSLPVVADPALLRDGLQALIGYLAACAGDEPVLQVSAEEAPDGRLQLELSVTPPPLAATVSLDPVKAALHLTLARMVADAHGGAVELPDEGAGRVALWLPPEPPSGVRWPPSSVANMASPAAAGPGPSGPTEAVDLLWATRGLPGFRRPPQLPPPAVD